MKARLKDLNQQVIVITGASSGIGLATAKMAAKRGAKVVLAARNEEGLKRSAEEIRQAGGAASYVVADVGSEDDCRRIAERAIAEFGRFDTWVNDAGVSIYGTFEQITAEDGRKLFETNFWGVVNGSKVAAEHLRDRGGAIINLGSVESDAALPLQSIYGASKHAVKAFTISMRMEIEKAGWPVSVTLIKPSGIDTPLFEHARNYMPNEPKAADPAYTPDIAAETILYAACNPVRELFVGGAGRGMSFMAKNAPRMAELVAERKLFDDQQTSTPRSPQASHNLFRGGGSGRERGHHPGRVKSRSLYTQMELHPLITGLGMLAAGLAVAGLASMAFGGGGRTSHRPWSIRRRGGHLSEGDTMTSHAQPGRSGDARADNWLNNPTDQPSDLTARKGKGANAFANPPAHWEAERGGESAGSDLSEAGRTPPASEAPESGEGSAPPPQRL